MQPNGNNDGTKPRATRRGCHLRLAAHQQRPTTLTILLVEGGLAGHSRIHLVRLQTGSQAVSGSERQRAAAAAAGGGVAGNGATLSRCSQQAFRALAHRLRRPGRAAVLPAHSGACWRRAAELQGRGGVTRRWRRSAACQARSAGGALQKPLPGVLYKISERQTVGGCRNKGERGPAERLFPPAADVASWGPFSATRALGVPWAHSTASHMILVQNSTLQALRAPP